VPLLPLREMPANDEGQLNNDINVSVFSLLSLDVTKVLSEAGIFFSPPSLTDSNVLADVDYPIDFVMGRGWKHLETPLPPCKFFPL